MPHLQVPEELVHSHLQEEQSGASRGLVTARSSRQQHCLQCFSWWRSNLQEPGGIRIICRSITWSTGGGASAAGSAGSKVWQHQLLSLGLQLLQGSNSWLVHHLDSWRNSGRREQVAQLQQLEEPPGASSAGASSGEAAAGVRLQPDLQRRSKLSISSLGQPVGAAAGALLQVLLLVEQSCSSCSSPHHLQEHHLRGAERSRLQQWEAKGARWSISIRKLPAAAAVGRIGICRSIIRSRHRQYHRQFPHPQSCGRWMGASLLKSPLSSGSSIGGGHPLRPSQ